MFPIDILNILSTVNNLSLQSAIKRYILAAELHFYNHKANSIEVFNSFTELAANYPASGTRQYINVRNNPVIKDVILEPSINWALSTTVNAANYLAITQFNLSFIVDGKRLYYRYAPSSGANLLITSTTDKKYFESAQAAAKLQTELNAMLAVAKSNQQRLTQLSNQNLNSVQRNLVNQAIVQHNFTLNTFAASLPKEIIVTGQNFSAATIKDAIGVLPVIVYIVAIIVGAGAVTYTVVRITELIQNAKKHKATLESNAFNLEKQLQAAQQYATGQITQQGYNDIMQQTQSNIQQNNENIKQLAQEPPGFMDKLQGLLILGIGGMFLLKVMEKK